MAILRTIPFGYAIENGKTVINEIEAETVRYIFSEYANGKILREIAEELTARRMIFYREKDTWNKNMIARIIQDKRYVGEKEYPAVVDIALYEIANGRKAEKGFTKAKQSDETVYLKSFTYCEQCGSLMYRRPTWATREKWLCKSGCKFTAYIDDAEILSGMRKVLQTAKENPSLLQSNEMQPTYVRTQEIVRYTNEINRMTGELAPSFPAGKKLILECAAKKFLACTENVSNAYTDSLMRIFRETEDCEHFTVAFLKRTVERIFVCADGNIKVRFVNGSEIRSDADYDANAE